MAPIVITLLYPIGKKFDMDYYLKNHMTTVEKQFSAHGLQKWEVIQAAPDSGYSTVCILHFKDKEGADAAFAGAGEIMKDIPNYTDSQPISIGGQYVGGN